MWSIKNQWKQLTSQLCDKDQWAIRMVTRHTPSTPDTLPPHLSLVQYYYQVIMMVTIHTFQKGKMTGYKLVHVFAKFSRSIYNTIADYIDKQGIVCMERHCPYKLLGVLKSNAISVRRRWQKCKIYFFHKLWQGQTEFTNLPSFTSWLKVKNDTKRPYICFRHRVCLP